MKELGGILLVMLAVVILGNLWFHLVESLLDRVRRWRDASHEQPAWHTLSEAEKQADCPSDMDSSDTSGTTE